MVSVFALLYLMFKNKSLWEQHWVSDPLLISTALAGPWHELCYQW